MKSIVFWKDVDVPIVIKMTHIRKYGGRTYNAFINDCGDLPVGVLNTITKQMMPVVNNRGLAYAGRNRLRYKRNKKREQ